MVLEAAGLIFTEEALMTRIDVRGISLNTVDQGAGAPLLLVHGFPLDHTMWQGQITALSKTQRVIAPDLRGFGASGVTSGTVSMEQFADDLNALLDSLKISEPVTLCGLSMGGYIAFAFYRKYKSRLKSLILCDTRAVADTPEAAESRRKLADKVVEEGARVVAEGMLPKLFGKAASERQPQVVEATRQVMLRTDPQGIAAALRGMAQRADSTSLLSQIDVPTLVLVGKEDAISTSDEMRGVAASIAKARFVEVPAAGHMAPLESPTLVNDAISAFLPA
jgi:pimeloyl-ACP methyl ester carboxylesterase